MRRLSTRAAGLLILILGIWGGLVPFLGPYFHFALGPNHSWTWTSGRFWLSVLPGIVAIIGGLMLLGSGPRPGGKLGALLALAAGIWFAVGPEVSLLWNSAGAAGVPHGSRFIRTLELLTYHTLLGTVMAALAGYALPGLVTRRAAAEAEAEAEMGATGAETAAMHDRDGRVPAGVTPQRGPITAQREPSAAEREPVADGREPVASGREPAVDAREPVASGREPAGDGREPVASGREPAGDVREPVASGRNDGGAQTAVLDRPVQMEQQQTADRSGADVPARADGSARVDAPSAGAAGPVSTGAAGPVSTGAAGPATTHGAAGAGSPEPVTMRRRRGGLLSRLRG